MRNKSYNSWNKCRAPKQLTHGHVVPALEMMLCSSYPFLTWAKVPCMLLQGKKLPAISRVTITDDDILTMTQWAAVIHCMMTQNSFKTALKKFSRKVEKTVRQNLYSYINAKPLNCRMSKPDERTSQDCFEINHDCQTQERWLSKRVFLCRWQETTRNQDQGRDSIPDGMSKEMLQWQTYQMSTWGEHTWQRDGYHGFEGQNSLTYGTDCPNHISKAHCFRCTWEKSKALYWLL